MKTHRDLKAWAEARAVTLLVMEAARVHWKPWAGAIFAQLLRASLSVQLNIAEGASYGRTPSYTKHLRFAYGSAVETGELIDLLKEAGVLPDDMLHSLREHSALSQRLLLGLIKRNRYNKGAIPSPARPDP